MTAPPAPTGPDPANGPAALQALANFVGHRGKAIISTAEVIPGPGTYQWMTTPDRVDDIVVPTGALVAVLFEAEWTGGSAVAGLHVDDITLQAQVNGAWGVSYGEASRPNDAVRRRVLTHQGGVFGTTNAADLAAAAPPVTGYAAGAINDTLDAPGKGAPCFISLPAGTYDIGVKFQSSGTPTTVRNRKLWVWTIPFG